MSKKTIKLQIINSQREDAEIRLEPWGEIHAVAPEDAIDIEAIGPSEGVLQFEIADGAIVIHGWEGSVVRLFRNGVELGV